jgi:flagellar L-ring protein precursor FlgH
MKPVAFAAVVCVAAPALAQNLMREPPAAPAPDAAGVVDTQAPLRESSLILVQTPRPRTYQVHDKITIIINETSRQASEQSLNTKKESDFEAAIEKFPDLKKLIEGELTNGNSEPIVEVEANADTEWKGDGKYERSDKFTDRITATVIDVKPNGVLVLEARRSITKDKEVQSLVLSGECRREDVTDNNTVLSSQLADLALLSENEGDVKESATKGWITQVFEAVFNF